MISGLPVSSTASGIKWRNAPPINAPAERLTRMRRILFKSASLTANAITPINAINAIMSVLPIIVTNSILQLFLVTTDISNAILTFIEYSNIVE